MWKRFLKDFFSFSSSDRNGIVVLTVLVILVLMASYLIPLTRNKPDKTHLAEFESLLSRFYIEDNELVNNNHNHIPEWEPFQFDPNKISREEMRLLGFNDQLARTFEKYLAGGGRFRSSDDLRKIYGMTDSLYLTLQPYVLIASSRDNLFPFVKDPPSREKLMIEINTADTSLLMKLPGIGKVYSSRIVRYRELLGGFYSINQVGEVYGISSELYKRISDQLEADTAFVVKIDLNNASFSQLLKHPYITRDQADRIMWHLRNEGCFSSPEELVKKGIIDSLSFQRLKNYLIFLTPEDVNDFQNL